MTSLAFALNSSASALFGLGGAYNSSVAYNHSQPGLGVVLNYTGPIVDLFSPKTDLESPKTDLEKYGALVKEAVESIAPLRAAAVLPAVKVAVDAAEEGIAQAAPSSIPEKVAQSASQMNILFFMEMVEPTIDELNALSAEEVGKLDTYLIDNLSDDIFKGLSEHVRMNLSAKAKEVVAARDLNCLTDAEIGQLSADRVNELPAGALKYLDARVLNGLSDEALGQLQAKVLNNLPFSQVIRLDSCLIGKLSPDAIKLLSYALLNYLMDQAEEAMLGSKKPMYDQAPTYTDTNTYTYSY